MTATRPKPRPGVLDGFPGGQEAQEGKAPGLEPLKVFVGFGERPDWKVESWTEKGTHAECAADFKRWHPLVHEIIAKVAIP